MPLAIKHHVKKIEKTPLVIKKILNLQYNPSYKNFKFVYKKLYMKNRSHVRD